MGEMHYVFQLSHLNPVYAANTGHWRMIHCAVSDCKPTQHPVFDRERLSDIKQVCHRLPHQEKQFMPS